MRPNYNGVKYYGAEDMSLGCVWSRAKNILDSENGRFKCENINEAIELYNVARIIAESNMANVNISQYKSKIKEINAVVYRYFGKINDGTIIEMYRNVCAEYIDDFWKLFASQKLYKRISKLTFKKLLQEQEPGIYRLLEQKKVVMYYDTDIAEFMRVSKETAQIIIKIFLERRSNLDERGIYLPPSLGPEEFEQILENYVNSEFANPSYIDLIANSQSSAECPISDCLRLMAKNKMQQYFDDCKNGTAFYYKVSVCFKENIDAVNVERQGNKFIFSYDKKWIIDHLDFATLLNNFIHLFNYVDSYGRCTFPTENFQSGLLAELIATRGKKEYERKGSFDLFDIKSTLDIYAYSEILSEFDIRIEDLIQWFFDDYLKTEFAINDFVVNMPSAGCNLLERCKILPSEMDGVFKQFKMHATDQRIDRELLEISSNPVVLSEISSMVSDKYAYANSNEIHNEMFYMFSDQSMLCHVDSKYAAKNFHILLNTVKLNITDFGERRIEELNWLKNRGVIFFDVDGTIKQNPERIALLSELYYRSVVCMSYYEDKKMIESLVSSKDLRIESTLFSIPEQNYLNFVLNKSAYSNGLDLRNKYIHSTYPLKKEQQQEDYMIMLKVMAVIVIKINEELCLKTA